MRSHACIQAPNALMRSRACIQAPNARMRSRACIQAPNACMRSRACIQAPNALMRSRACIQAPNARMRSRACIQAPNAHVRFGGIAKMRKRKHLVFTIVSGYWPKIQQKTGRFFGRPLSFVSRLTFLFLGFFSQILVFFAFFSWELFFLYGHHKLSDVYIPLLFKRCKKRPGIRKKVTWFSGPDHMPHDMAHS